MLVARVLISHTDALESDLLMHFNGVDIKDLFTGRLSYRRLAVLINRLLGMYSESAVSIALLGEPARWGNIEYLIADLIDRVEVSNWLMTQVHKAENASNPIPEPYPRPGAQRSSAGVEGSMSAESEPQLASALDLQNWFAQIA